MASLAIGKKVVAGGKNLRVTGQAPLSAANPFIEPRAVSGPLAFDLAVNGPPGLSSVSGRLTASGARLVAPALGLTLRGLSSNDRRRSPATSLFLSWQ